MNKIKNSKRFLALFLSLLMCFGLLQTTSLAANWNPGDLITINVRVFDESTGAAYSVGTDYVAKGDVNIQSVGYQIPQLTKFVSASQFGRVTKVAGNWYFPAGDSQPGATVEWSCNVNSVTMTYWVNWYSTGTGGGTGSNQNQSESVGGSGSYSWTQYIRYHSNYPDGTDYIYTVAYNVRAYTTIYNTFGGIIKSLSAVGFSVPNGYTAKSPIWNTAKNGTGTGYSESSSFVFYQSDNGKYLDLYAQWEPAGGTPVTPVTLTYMDGNTVYATRNYFAGDIATAILCQNEKPGYSFAGWDTSPSAQTVVYLAGVEFTINGNMTLYAVWVPVAPTTTTLKVQKLVAGDLYATQLPSTFFMTATIINEGVQTVYLNNTSLEAEVDISTTVPTTVVLTEMGYEVAGYDCTATASNGSPVTYGTVTFTIPAGTVEPICAIINTYVSNVEPNKQLASIEKERLTSVPAGLGLTDINTSNPVNLKDGESATLLYAITVTGDEGANYIITDEGTTYVGGDAMSGTIGSSGKATVYVTKTITIDDVVNGYVENIAYVEAGADTDPIPGTDPGDTTPSDPSIVEVNGELVTTKTYVEQEDRQVDFTVEVTNRVGATLGAVRLADSMTGVTMVMDADGNPIYTIKLYSKDGVETIPTVTSATSDGKESEWIIDGPIDPDAKIVLTYSGIIDPDITAADKWTNVASSAFRKANSAMLYDGLDSIGDDWQVSNSAFCEGVIEQ